MCVDVVLCYRCTLLPVGLSEQAQIVWIKIVRLHACNGEVHIVSVQIVLQSIASEVQIACTQIPCRCMKKS